MRIPLYIYGALLCCASSGVSPASGALLRPFSQIATQTIRLRDLFDQMGATPDRVLGQAPAPGDRIVVEAPQLAAIARDFGVDWRPESGAERAVVERRGDILPRASIDAALRAALQAQGASQESEIAMPAPQDIVIPAGVPPAISVTQVSYEPSGGRFTALLSVRAEDMTPVQARLSGQSIAMSAASTLMQRMPAGTVLQAGDLRPVKIRSGLLHGNQALSPEQLAGMVLKRDVPAGQPLTSADVSRKILVARGAPVRMTLDSAGMSLTAQGIAQQPGSLGDRIHVQNPVSHAVVEAVVEADGDVRVLPNGGVIHVAAAP